jgi:hypothetical protein
MQLMLDDSHGRFENKIICRELCAYCAETVDDGRREHCAICFTFTRRECINFRGLFSPATTFWGDFFIFECVVARSRHDAWEESSIALLIPL